MFKKILRGMFEGVRDGIENQSRVFLVRDHGGHMDSFELFGDAQDWDRVAISQWAVDADALYGFSADPDQDGIDDWKGQGWACGFYASDPDDAVRRVRNGDFTLLPPWFPG